MHDAYEAIPILEKLPLEIESVAAYDENLVVGTRQGHLLMYSVTPGSTRRWDVALLCSNKNFSRKPIVQVAVVPEHQIIVSLSDNVISVHDLTVFNLPLLCTISQTKGAATFDLDIKHLETQTGDVVVTVRLAVAVRRRLQLYYWKARQFHSLREDLPLPDVPLTITWCREAIAVAFKQEYWLVELTGTQKELFATGRSQEPQITVIESGEQLALAHDRETVFVDAEGNAATSNPLKWDEQPAALAYHKPYIIAILQKSIMIKTAEPPLTVQAVQLDKPKLIVVGSSSKGKSQVYIASASHVWCLHFLPINQQIPQLLTEKQFGLALKLVDVWEEAEDAKGQMRKHIRHLQAIHLFCNKEYSAAMKIFLSLNTDLLFVIGLCPDMVPEKYHSRLQYPCPLPSLRGADLEQALQALVPYLLEIRHKVSSPDGSEQSSISSLDKFSLAASSLESRNKTLQIIDTTLLKCYLQTNDSLVRPLLRMPDNHVNVDEGEKVLRKANKYPEVVLLHRVRGEHQRALDLLLRHSKKPSSPLFGHHNTVSYLQHLGPQHIDLIFEYGGWVLQAYPADGLKIFIGDKSNPGEAEQLPRPKVLNFLKKTEKSLVIPYLEHVVEEWKDSTTLLHNELILQYRDLATATSTATDPATMEQEKQQQQFARQKLIKFLNESEHYAAATLLAHLSRDCLYEERAVLLGRLGQHHEALTIHIHTLGSLDSALTYCKKHYTPAAPGSEVYLILLKLLVSPSVAASHSVSASKAKVYTDNKMILELLHTYLQYIDLKQALKVLPDNLPLQMMKSFLGASLNLASTTCRERQVARGLTQSLKLQTSEELVDCQRRKIILSEYTACAVCRKRFTKHSAFAWYPSGEVVHFSCHNHQ